MTTVKGDRHTCVRRLSTSILAVGLALGSLALPQTAFAKGELTTFRGISVGMSLDEVSRVLPGEFYLSYENIIRRQDSKVCGAVSTEQITLFRCYFGADDYSFENFAQAILDSYNIPGMELVYETIGRSYMARRPSPFGRPSGQLGK